MKFPEALCDVDTENEVVAHSTLSNTHADRVLDQFESGDFSHPGNRAIIAAVAAVRVDDGDVSAVSVRRMLKGSPEAAAHLLGLPSGGTQPKEHFKRLRGLRESRDLCARLRVADAELEQGTPAGEVGDRLAADVDALIAKPTGTSFDGEAQVRELTRAIAEMEGSPDGIIGLRTGMRDLDRVLGGLRREQLVILGARPAQGKTAWALTVALNVALAGEPVQVFSMEMSVRQMVFRLVAMLSGLSRGAIARGQYDRVALRRAEDQIRSLPLKIEALSDPSVAQIVARMKVERSRGRLSLAIVDYLGLIRSEGRAGNRNDEVAKMSRALKVAAKSLEVPVIVLSQFNRNVDHRENKSPSLADFRDSGQIEADADVAIGIHAPNAENIDPAERSKVDLVVLKNRDGRVGRVPVHFDHERTLFSDRLQGPTEWNQTGSAA